MKSILINAVPEETRIAIVEDGELLSMEVERASHTHQVGNIYKGHVQNVLPGMQAAFVDIGGEKNAFLYIGDGMPKEVIQILPVQSKIHIGQSLPIQIIKDAIGTKGPRATVHLSLPGRNVVLMPTAAYIGISRRIEAEEERSRLHDIAQRICPEGMGLIVRTVAAGQSEETLTRDVQYLTRLWASLMARNRLASAPELLYRDADLVIRMVRDSFTEDIDELVIDDAGVFQRVQELLRYTSPALMEKVRHYEGRQSIFRKYQVDEEIKRIGDREVSLSSGGFIVIDKTEALTAIDVNTGKFVGQANLSDTVYRINLEAGAEIMKQLRLRDIGGIILVDFIDMEREEQKEELLAFLRERARHDRMKTNIVDITSLGLVEITRKKSRQNFESIIYSECPYCHGRGRVESPETVSIRICRELRRLEARSHASGGYEISVHEQVAEAIARLRLIEGLEKELGVSIEITVQPGMHPESCSISKK